jgi:hypothetical protein
MAEVEGEPYATISKTMSVLPSGVIASESQARQSDLLDAQRDSSILRR